MNSKEIYDLCIEKAIESPCQKRGFGAVLMMGGNVVALTNNHHLEVAGHICDPTCIRFKIDSGSDSMIGACGHAEEHAVWQATKIYGDLSSKMAMLYVAGVSKPDNVPLVKTEPFFYCIRCATLMNYAGIFGVNVWVDERWHFLNSKEAYQSSLDFALKLRKA